jgi:quercetin dioxygenase-like cupin family protein
MNLAMLGYNSGGAEDWEPHPFAEGLEQRVLLTKRDHGADVSIFMYRIKAGAAAQDVPEHVHADADDITYMIAGSADVEVEGQVQTMRAGGFLRIPKGMRHRVFNVSSDFVGINVFSPATV